MTEKKVFLDSPEAIERHLVHDLELESFAGNGVRLVLCDRRNQVLSHYHVCDAPTDVTTGECAQALRVLAQRIPVGRGDAILVALIRPGPIALTASDGHWFHAAHTVWAQRAVRLLGVHVVTPRGQREVVLDDVL
jgi:hypothetical protein